MGLTDEMLDGQETGQMAMSRVTVSGSMSKLKPVTSDVLKDLYYYIHQ